MQPEQPFQPEGRLGRDCGGWITATLDNGDTVTFQAQSIPARLIDDLINSWGGGIRPPS